MSSYCYEVCLPTVCTTVSLPAEPPPPPFDPRPAFRSSCVSHYHAARQAGFDHLPAIREASRRLKVSGHPWHTFEVVRHEISEALGLRRGRPAKGQAAR